MVKINPVIVQNLAVSDRTAAQRSGSIGAEKGSSGNDMVSISDEGKKRHILGQVMASISERNAFKKPY